MVVGSDSEWRDQVAQAQVEAASAPTADALFGSSALYANAPQASDVVFVAAPVGKPPAMAMWPGRSMSLGDTIISDSRVFQAVPKDSCCDELRLFICPCCPHVDYVAYPQSFASEQLSFKNLCTWCCCDWGVTLGRQELGTMSLPGCCDNGCWYSCCQACICSGTYSILNFKAAGRTKFTIRKKLYCCWCPVEAACSCCCLPAIACCNSCTKCPCDTCNYCSSYNAVVTEEAIYPAMEVGDHQVGTIRMVEAIAFRQGTCCPVRTVASFQVEFIDHTLASHNDTLLLGLLPMMWRGLQTSGCCPSPAPIRKPSADCCLGGGRIVNEHYTTFGEAMAVVENPVDKLAAQLGASVSTSGRLNKVSARGAVANEMER